MCLSTTASAVLILVIPVITGSDLDSAHFLWLSRVLASRRVSIWELVPAHCTCIVCFDPLRLQVLDYLKPYMFEYLPHILTRLGTGLEETEPVLLRQGPPLFAVYFLLVFRHVRLVSDQNFLYVWQSMLIDLFEPVLNIVECRLFSAVIHKQNAHGALVIRLGDRPESLLASSVPHL